jgi:hypothetical protein
MVSVKQREQSDRPQPNGPIISVEQVVKTYDTGAVQVHALSGVSLVV